MKKFTDWQRDVIEATTCSHNKEGDKCPVHGTKECPEVIETPRKKSKNYLLNNKTITEKWSDKYKKSINCDNPKGFSQRAHCQGKKKSIGEAKEKDHEYSMARSELKTVTNAAKRLQKKMGKKGEGNLQAWVQSKITKAADYIDTAADYVTNEETKSGDSSLRDWFTKSRASDGTPGWVQLGGKYAGKPCAKQPGQTTKPKCGSSKMKRNLNDEEEQRAFERKNRQDPNPNRKGKAKNVATEAVDASKYGGPENLLKKLVKKHGGGEVVPSTPKKSANVKESYLRIQERGKTYSILLNWRGKSITTQMFFPKFGRPSKSEVLGEIVKVYPGAKVLYYNPVLRDPTQPLLFAGVQNEPRQHFTR